MQNVVDVFKNLLKGQLHEIFDPFFPHSTPPRALIQGLKLFCIWPNKNRKNRQYSYFSGVNDPTETVFAGVIDPVDTISAGSLTNIFL
jgi:hypothetical protein